MAETTKRRGGTARTTESGMANWQGGDAMGVLRALPDELEAAGDAVAGAVRGVSASVSTAPDDTLLVGASVATGLALGLLLAGAPRLLAAVAVAAALMLGTSLVQRHPSSMRGVG